MLRYNKKAQTAETISWIVATLVIIGILLIFIYISVLMSKVKVVGIGDVKTDLGEGSAILNIKTSLANQLTNGKNKDVIDNILKQDDK